MTITTKKNEEYERTEQFFFRGEKLKVHMSFVMLKLTEKKKCRTNFTQLNTEYVWNGCVI